MRYCECEIGMKVGKLLIKDRYRDSYTGYTHAICDCDCGAKNADRIISHLNAKYPDRICCGKNCPLRYRKPPKVKLPKIIKEPKMKPFRPINFVKVGDKFGKLLVKEIWRDKEKGQMYIRCDCECGSTNYVRQPNSLNERSGCGCNRNKYTDLTKSDKNNTCKTERSKYFSSPYYNDFKRHALNDKKEFNLSISDFDIIYERQNGLCFYTGEKLTLPNVNKPYWHKKHKHEYNISVDRIDSSIKEYSLDNCVFCTKVINWFKNKNTTTQFYNLCKSVASNKSFEDYVASKVESCPTLS